MKKKFKIIYLIISMTLIITGGILQLIDFNAYQQATKAISQLYKNEKRAIPVDNITDEQIKDVENKIEKISSSKMKKEMRKKLDELKNYLNLKSELNNLFNNDILKHDVTNEQVSKVLKNYNNLPKQYQQQLTSQIECLKGQFNNITDTIQTINNLFQDSTNLSIRDNLTRTELSSANTLFNNLPQKDSMLKEQEYLNIAEEQLTKKEEEKLLQIKNAWVILDVPYISQNLNKVYNGCEAASLLMGLKYKGYLQNMDIVTYSTNMPKTNDPHTGFYRSIFDVEPSDLPHWIAPSPLAKYGRDTSGNNNVIDISGSSLDQLDKELENNNPVIIYATAMFKEPKNWKEEVPNNLHIMLLTGYNKITGEQIVTDPWTYSNGRKKWQLSKDTLESLYNKIGKRAVAIR